jgi:hypothetical protein
MFLSQLIGQLIIQQPPRGREQDNPRVLPIRIGSLQRRIDNINPENHPRPTPIGRIINLPSAKRSGIAIVEQTQFIPLSQSILHRPLTLKPLEGLGEERENVESHAAILA